MKKENPINISPIATIITDRMKAKGINNKQLSEITGIPAPMFSEWFGGKRRFPAKGIVVMASALGLDAYELGRMNSDYYISQAIRVLYDKALDNEL